MHAVYFYGLIMCAYRDAIFTLRDFHLQWPVVDMYAIIRPRSKINLRKFLFFGGTFGVASHALFVWVMPCFEAHTFICISSCKEPFEI